jgi:hypothetical protein
MRQKIKQITGTKNGFSFSPLSLRLLLLYLLTLEEQAAKMIIKKTEKIERYSFNKTYSS